VRAYARYQGDAGDRLAAGVTYFAFLAFFPLVALAFSIAGFVVDAYPDARDTVIRQINDYLPGLSDRLSIESIGNAKVGAGLVGLGGLLLAGLGWVDALRDALRTMWHHNVQAGNMVMRKVKDVGILAGLGLTLLASTAMSGVATSATRQFLELVNLDRSTPAKAVTLVLAIVVSTLVDVAVFVYLFTRLTRLHEPLDRVVRGAVLGAVGVEVLKIVGTLLVGRATGNPVYLTFGVIVGLLIWINMISRWTLFVAAWTVTAPYSGDVSPSGTAGPHEARRAGIPVEYADHGPDDAPATMADGAPAPLGAALRGQPVAGGQEGAGRVDTADGGDTAGGGDTADGGDTMDGGDTVGEQARDERRDGTDSAAQRR
jgi:membrane protein